MGALALLGAHLLGLSAGEPSTATLRSATLAAVGDIRLDGPVGRIIASEGPAAPTSGVRGALSADILFGNLECSVTSRGEKREKTWTFRAPPKNAAALKEAGFTIVSLANNHTMDYGPTGLLDTLKAVGKNGILSVGAGKDRAQAESLRVIEAGGLRVGFLGFTSTFPQEAWARKDRPGVAYSDFARFPDVIRAAKARCDVLVVSFHGGTELAPEPNDIQKAFARAAVEAGADLVLGHHPHVLQPVEVHNGVPILHSLGNFLFVSPSPETRATVIARARLGQRGVELVEFVPIDGNWGRPVPAGEEIRRKAYEAVNALGAFDAHPELLRWAP